MQVQLTVLENLSSIYHSNANELFKVNPKICHAIYVIFLNKKFGFNETAFHTQNF